MVSIADSREDLAKDPKELNQLLIKYHDDTVRIDREQRRKNELIALTFVNTFAQFVTKVVGLGVSFVGQGSAFEEVNVREADEFDFLLVVQRREQTPLESREADAASARCRHDLAQISGSDCGWRCYYPILLPHSYPNVENDAHSFCGYPNIANDNDFYSYVVENWPGTDIECISAGDSITYFRFLLSVFDKAFTDGTYSLPGVSSLHWPEFHRPALTTRLVTNDGTEISVDISISFCLLSERKFVYYIAKTKPIHRDIDDPRIGYLWLTTFSQEEMQLLETKSETQRRNYRIVKSLFAESCVKNSYVWKTLFMSPYLELSDEPLVFVGQLLRALEGSIYAELKLRKLNPRGEYRGALLVSRFNACENILARYDDAKLREWYAWVQNQNQRSKLGLDFIKQLFNSKSVE